MQFSKGESGVSHPSIQSLPAVSTVLSPDDVAELARLYGALVYRAAYRLVGTRAAAQDVQQDLFLRLLQSPPSAVRSWPAYLTAAAVRLALNQLRGRRQWTKLVQFWSRADSVSESSAEEVVAADETADRFRRALGRLKPIEAQCFALRYLHSFEIAEVATSVGISENYVSVCLHRAVKRLQDLQLGSRSPAEI
jgi:RNA polymerase sigma factor (sigma-70 family)